MSQPVQNFDYSNLNTRPQGPYMRLGSLLSSRIREVQQQIVPYAVAWQSANRSALTRTAGPLWVVLGDSMAQGIGASSPEHGWVGQLNNMLQTRGKRYRILNLSMSGGRIKDVLEHQLPAMEQLGVTPDLVTVMIGSNDLMRGKYRATLLQDLERLLSQLPQGTVIANLFGSAPIVRRANRMMYAKAREQGFIVADMDHGLVPLFFHGKVSSDKFHPNDAGYKDIATVFATAIIPT